MNVGSVIVFPLPVIPPRAETRAVARTPDGRPACVPSCRHPREKFWLAPGRLIAPDEAESKGIRRFRPGFVNIARAPLVIDLFPRDDHLELHRRHNGEFSRRRQNWLDFNVLCGFLIKNLEVA